MTTWIGCHNLNRPSPTVHSGTRHNRQSVRCTLREWVSYSRHLLPHSAVKFCLCTELWTLRLWEDACADAGTRVVVWSHQSEARISTPNAGSRARCSKPLSPLVRSDTLWILSISIFVCCSGQKWPERFLRQFNSICFRVLLNRKFASLLTKLFQIDNVKI